jgi:hypothetical protein
MKKFPTKVRVVLSSRSLTMTLWKAVMLVISSKKQLDQIPALATRWFTVETYITVSTNYKGQERNTALSITLAEFLF